MKIFRSVMIFWSNFSSVFCSVFSKVFGKLTLAVFVFASAFVSTTAFVSETAFAQDGASSLGVNGPEIAPRELMVLKPGLDSLWGSGIVAVMNRLPAARDFSFIANLPKETINFMPSEGVEKNELQLDKDGVVVKKSFAPGINVVGLAFNVPAVNGSSEMTFRLTRSLPEMIVMTPAGLLKLQSDGLQFQTTDVQQGERYDVYSLKSPMNQGQELRILVTGIPMGRNQLWLAGGLFAFVLVGGVMVLAYKSKPSTQEILDQKSV